MTNGGRWVSVRLMNCSGSLCVPTVASRRAYKATVESFTDAWAELGKRLKKRSVGNLTHKAWAKLDAEMKAKNYPAIHHSASYEKANHPAYRVLTKSEMQKLLANLK